MPIASRNAGVLGTLEVPIALGLLRLSTEGRPAEADAVTVIHEALDRGIRVLDTADSYGLDHTDLHYGERLARLAIQSWNGPREQVMVLTKAGLARPKGRWVPDGRPAHLREAVDRSLTALGVERLFVLQLHARDPGVPFEDTLGALAELQKAGKVQHLGLCNVGIAEIRQAKRHFPIALVQNELSVLNRKSATDGTLEFARREGMAFLAHRPLGGYAKVAKLDKNRVLVPLAQRHATDPRNVALAALLNAADHVIPLAGATRVESVRAGVAACGLELDISDRTALGHWFSFDADPEAPLEAAPVPQVSSTVLQPDRGPGTAPEVVILMGIQGAGKSELVAEYERAGYARLNRDLIGGTLEKLIPRLTELLAAGCRRVVLDNTYPTRISRAPVVAAAASHGVPVRCRHLNTPPDEARFNVALRMIKRYGKLLGPDEIKTLGKTDPNLLPPAAMARWSGSFEPPAADEGFAAVDVIPFLRRVETTHTRKGLLLDVDGTLRACPSGELYPRTPDDIAILPGRRETLARWAEAGWTLFLVSNQSGVASGKLTIDDARACFERTVELLGVPVAEAAFCPHPAFPLGCFCRKPMPGLGTHLIVRHGLTRDRLIMVGDMASDAAFAAALGARYYEADKFFGFAVDKVSPADYNSDDDSDGRPKIDPQAWVVPKR